MLDIHSHILPGVDDGARDVETSIELLRMMKEQGITHVIATPHFDAMHQSIDEFQYAVSDSYKRLSDAMYGLDLPQVSIGSEVFYFPGIGRSAGVRDLTLCRSDYLLLELPSCRFTNDILKDISDLNNRVGVMPIIAHIERYSCERGFKSLLSLISNGEAYAQINASSVLTPPYKKIVHKLISRGYISFMATDTHSIIGRPPLMGEALKSVELSLGKNYSDRFILNSERFCKEIFRILGEKDEK